MSRNIRIVGFTGNKRQDSYNKSVLQSALSLLPEQTELEILSVADLPSFEQGAEASELVLHFRAKLEQADAVLIASPEYKGLLPTGLKNALAWALQYEDASVLTEKPTAIMGIGRQSQTEQQSFRQLLIENHVSVLASPAVYVSADEKFDHMGNLAHEETKQQIRALLSALAVEARASRSVLVG